MLKRWKLCLKVNIQTYKKGFNELENTVSWSEVGGRSEEACLGWS